MQHLSLHVKVSRYFCYVINCMILLKWSDIVCAVVDIYCYYYPKSSMWNNFLYGCCFYSFIVLKLSSFRDLSVSHDVLYTCYIWVIQLFKLVMPPAFDVFFVQYMNKSRTENIDVATVSFFDTVWVDMYASIVNYSVQPACGYVTLLCFDVQECELIDPCCDAETCLLKPYATCRSGACCQNCTVSIDCVCIWRNDYFHSAYTCVCSALVDSKKSYHWLNKWMSSDVVCRHYLTRSSLWW